MIRAISTVTLVAVLGLTTPAHLGLESSRASENRSRDSLPTHIVQQASAGGLKALLSYFRIAHDESFTLNGNTHTYTTYSYANIRVSILHDANVVFTQLLNCACQPAAPALGKKTESLHWAHLSSMRQQQLLVDLCTGGAHCCFLTRIYAPELRTIAVVTHNWGDPGYRLADLDQDGLEEFISADDRFAYAFTSFAYSAFPLRIFQLHEHSLRDVTRRFPKQIAQNASRIWHGYLRERKTANPDLRGILAAWAADESLLGKWKSAHQALELAAARGELDSADTGFSAGPGTTAKQYIEKLTAFLAKNGYR